MGEDPGADPYDRLDHWLTSIGLGPDVFDEMPALKAARLAERLRDAGYDDPTAFATFDRAALEALYDKLREPWHPPPNDIAPADGAPGGAAPPLSDEV